MLRLTLALMLAALPARAEPPRIVTDIAPVQSLVASVTGTTPDALVGAGNDPHGFQFRPSQARAIARAEMLIWVGPGLIPWLGDEARSVNPDLVLHALAADGAAHPWLDPAIARDWLGQIADIAAASDPASAATYRANAAEAAAGIEALTAEIAATLAPAKGKRLVVAHDAYDALAGRFGLTIVAAIADSDADDPGAAHLHDLSALIAGRGVDCILIEPSDGSEHAAILAEAGTVAMARIDPLGSALPPGPGQYAALLRQMAHAIAECGE